MNLPVLNDSNFIPRKKRLSTLPAHEDAIKAPCSVGRFPSWLHKPLPTGSGIVQTHANMRKNGLYTVCEEAKCPNITECWSKKSATFLVMGKECTRACGFCDIDFSKSPKALDPEEPKKVALSVQELGLKHVVITMVARDDLLDQGAAHLVKVIDEIRLKNPTCTVEVLTSDFFGKKEILKVVLEAKPEIFNHNIETVRSLTSKVRHKATYERTLNVLKDAKALASYPVLVKSGLMVGLGESFDEVVKTLQDLKEASVDIVTIGQYLQPNNKKLRMQAFIPPNSYNEWKEKGLALGIPFIFSGPFVRSSYNASEVFEQIGRN